MVGILMVGLVLTAKASLNKDLLLITRFGQTIAFVNY